MRLYVACGSTQFVVEEKAWDLTTPVDCNAQLEAFGLPRPTTETVCRTVDGASVNVENFTFCAHSNGTHTECVGHVVNDPVLILRVAEARPSPGFLCALVTVKPQSLKSSGDTYPSERASPEDPVISLEELRSGISNCSNFPNILDDSKETVSEHIAGVLIRTSWSPAETSTSSTADAVRAPDSKQWREARRHIRWTGSSPPYLTLEAAQFLAKQEHVSRLLVDLPSVDREDDGGHVLVHKTFFGVELGSKTVPQIDEATESSAQTCKSHEKRLITELVCTPPDTELPDGVYFCELHLSPFADTDAVPSRVLLHRLSPPESS